MSRKRLASGIVVHHLSNQKDVDSPLPNLKDIPGQNISSVCRTPFQNVEIFMEFRGFALHVPMRGPY